MADPKDRPPDAVRKNLKGDWVDSKGNVIGSAGGGRAGHREVEFNAEGVLVFKDTGKPVPKKGVAEPAVEEKPAAEAVEEKAEAADPVATVKVEMASPGQTGQPRREEFAEGLVGESNYRKALKAYQDKLSAQKATAKSNANTMRQQ